MFILHSTGVSIEQECYSYDQFFIFNIAKKRSTTLICTSYLNIHNIKLKDCYALSISNSIFSFSNLLTSHNIYLSVTLSLNQPK